MALCTQQLWWPSFSIIFFVKQLSQDEAAREDFEPGYTLHVLFACRRQVPLPHQLIFLCVPRAIYKFSFKQINMKQILRPMFCLRITHQHVLLIHPVMSPATSQANWNSHRFANSPGDLMIISKRILKFNQLSLFSTRSWTFFGIVAPKSKSWRSDRMRDRIDRTYWSILLSFFMLQLDTWYSKPASSILSASSNTR